MNKAKDISGKAPGGKRMKLAEALPLKTPLVVQIFPVYACNFKCNYCIFQLNKKERGFISDKAVMDFDLYKKCVNELVLFPGKIKVLRFVGIGEPLLHKNIADMVKCAVSKCVASTVEILTNGSFLTPKISDALISAGLSRLVVSLQGISKEKYREVCGANIDFEAFIKNLKYFFDNKGRTQMYIKIIDCALDSKDDERKFYEIFRDICDTMAIEHVVPIHSGVDYGKAMKGKDINQTQFGLPVSEMKICPQPFFHMQINPDGKVVPCYSWDYPKIMGDCNSQSAYEIWNGKKFQNFRYRMLNGRNGVCKTCAECKISKYRLFPEDMISSADAERLKKFYKF
ncbi:SPASM domain-containing protein [Candidatus Wolfebacteria bacterium]|nr:SPASM domain-containing protein [Candidatus Wolfebacteria bacterium]